MVAVTRLGILGGTFDPIHIGHLLLAQETALCLDLQRVLIMPAARPWRKAGRAIAPAADRLAMAAVAIADNPVLQISDLEMQRGGATYTVDTLAALGAELGRTAAIWFILGTDALFDLPRWKSPERLIELARLAVTYRGAVAPNDLARLERQLPGIGQRIDLVPMPRVDISSTELRRRLRLGISTRYWLPETVAAYAKARGLYAGAAKAADPLS